MRLSPRVLFLTMFLAAGLTACDAPAEDNQNASLVTGSDLPVASSSPTPAIEEEDAGPVPPVLQGPQTVGEAAGEMVDIPEQTDVHSDVPPPSREVFVDAECDFEGWVGKPLDETGLKNTGRPYRILKPGDMMTMDHSPERINVEHTDGKVTRVWCG